MEANPKAAYESYIQIFEESRTEILYDVDERPMMIRQKDIGSPLSWIDWLDKEMKLAIREEEYLYAAKLRDEISLITKK